MDDVFRRYLSFNPSKLRDQVFDQIRCEQIPVVNLVLLFGVDELQGHGRVRAKLVLDSLLVVGLHQLRILPSVNLALGRLLPLRLQLLLSSRLKVKNVNSVVKSLLHIPGFVSSVPEGVMQGLYLLLLLTQVESPLV